jgi:type I restriction enzyme S subunit
MKGGWKTASVGDLCQVIGGGTPSKSKAKYYSGDIPWATVRDMCAEIIAETEFRITKEAVKCSATNVIPKGNVVIATRVGLGKMCLLGQDTAINQDLRGIIPIDPKLLTVRYLFWWLKSIADSIVAEGKGATVQGVKLPFVKALQVPFPPPPEQQRIVGILDKAFDDIATATANAEKNLQNASALFESHLQAVFTQRGKGWKEKTLEEIATTFGRGKSKHRPRNAPHLYGGKYPFVQTGDIRNADHIITEWSQTYSEAGLTQSKLWPKGTICITIAANIAETAILGFDACFPDSVIGVVANPKEAVIGFIEYLLQSFKARIQSMGKGSAQANINLGTFENERFPFPPVSEQKQIVAKLDSLREETKRLESIYQQKLAALDELKKSLLHQAFSGEL